MDSANVFTSLLPQISDHRMNHLGGHHLPHVINYTVHVHTNKTVKSIIT